MNHVSSFVLFAHLSASGEGADCDNKEFYRSQLLTSSHLPQAQIRAVIVASGNDLKINQHVCAWSYRQGMELILWNKSLFKTEICQEDASTCMRGSGHVTPW